jgi:hypothetical protein
METNKQIAIKKLRDANTVGDLSADQLAADPAARKVFESELSIWAAGGRTDQERDAAAAVRLAALEQAVINARD